MDFGKHSDSSIKILPAGTYRVQLSRWEKKVAGTGTEQNRWYARVANEGPYNEDSLVDHLSLTEAAEWRIGKFVMAALNLEKADMQAIGNIALGSEKFTRIMDACKERTMFWTITEEPNPSGKIVNKVIDYIPDPDQAKYDVGDLEEVPDFVRNKEA